MSLGLSIWFQLLRKVLRAMGVSSSLGPSSAFHQYGLSLGYVFVRRDVVDIIVSAVLSPLVVQADEEPRNSGKQHLTDNKSTETAASIDGNTEYDHLSVLAVWMTAEQADVHDIGSHALIRYDTGDKNLFGASSIHSTLRPSLVAKWRRTRLTSTSKEVKFNFLSHDIGHCH